MALDCGPHEWRSCINSSASTCESDDPAFEGTMEIDTPDPQTGDFEGWFYPKDGTQRRRLKGKCKEESYHMSVERVDADGKKHKYKGDKDGDHVKGQHTKTERKEPPADDDEWIATKVT